MSALRELAFAKILGGGGGSGGATNVVTGTFTPQAAEAGSVKTISMGYTGSGYPIALSIFPTSGAYNSDSTFYSTAHKKIINTYFAAKNNTNTMPDFSSNDDKNMAYCIVTLKNSDSDPTVYASGGVIKNYKLLESADPYNTSQVAVVKIKSSTSMYVCVFDTDKYGFLPETEYTYCVVYSA